MINNKVKNKSTKKDSHSRQHNSKIKSHSKSNQKSKPKVSSKLLFRQKGSDSNIGLPCQENAKHQTSHLQGHQIQTIKSTHHLNRADQYYNNIRNKSKSKAPKTQKFVQDHEKIKYVNSIYMHKQQNQQNHTKSPISIDGRNKVVEYSDKKKDDSSNLAQILKKVKILENGAIDNNGKFVTKPTRDCYFMDHHHSKQFESFQTISNFQHTDKKKQKKKKEKKKDILKVKSKKEDIEKIHLVRSADKFQRKHAVHHHQIKEFASPSILEKHSQKYYEAEIKNEIFQMRENPFVRVREHPQQVSGIPPKQPTLSNRTSKTILTQQTQTSPQFQLNSLHDLTSFKSISIPQILLEMQEQSCKKLDHNLLVQYFKHDLLSQRMECMQFLSKMCWGLSMRRQCYWLAIFYMDKYVWMMLKRQSQGNTLNKLKLKNIMMASLLLATKMDDGNMSRKLCYQYINHMDSVLGNFHHNSNKNHSQTKTQPTLLHHPNKAIQGTLSNPSQSKETSTNTNLSKSKSVLPDKHKKEEEKETNFKPQKVKEMESILALEVDMLLKFEFKLILKSISYWMDILTMLWDEYLNQDVSQEQMLLFRKQRNKSNMSHLYQVMQKLYLHPLIYQYETPIIILSVMYLIIRMRMEQQKQCLNNGASCKQIYDKYIINLNKSTNIIFYDNLGVNQLFGDYLSQIQMSLSDIVSCIQYVGKNFNSNLKTFHFNSKNKYINSKAHQHQLAMYEGSLDIYKAYH